MKSISWRKMAALVAVLSMTACANDAPPTPGPGHTDPRPTCPNPESPGNPCE